MCLLLWFLRNLGFLVPNYWRFVPLELLPKVHLEVHLAWWMRCSLILLASTDSNFDWKLMVEGHCLGCNLFRNLNLYRGIIFEDISLWNIVGLIIVSVCITIWLAILRGFKLLTLHQHLLLLLLLGLKHTLESISWVISWSVWHSMLSDGLILDHWWNNTLSSKTFHDIISGRNLRHWLFLINESKSWHLSLFSWVTKLKAIQNCHSEWEWSQISVDIHFPQSLISISVVTETREKFKVWPFLFSETILMSYQNSHMDERSISICHKSKSLDKDSINQVWLINIMFQYNLKINIKKQVW